MLCEVCHEKEATVRITRIHNGNSETHNLCQDCANRFGQEDPEAQDLSKAIFKLLAGALMKHIGSQNQGSEEDERVKKLSCPNCGKTYGEILEDGLLGCPDCYESFEPYIRPMILKMQGADTHTGKKAGSHRKKTAKILNVAEEKLSPKEELSVLSDRLKIAVSEENYEEAARLRDEIKKLKEEHHG